MMDRLKEILVNGINSANNSKKECSDLGLVFKGKSEAFAEVLSVIEQLENGDGKDSADQEKDEQE